MSPLLPTRWKGTRETGRSGLNARFHCSVLGSGSPVDLTCYLLVIF